jgi:hypothetical protein
MSKERGNIRFEEDDEAEQTELLMSQMLDDNQVGAWLVGRRIERLGAGHEKVGAPGTRTLILLVLDDGTSVAIEGDSLEVRQYDPSD